jgi:hypothetical protein
MVLEMACEGPKGLGTVYGHDIEYTLDSGATISVMSSIVYDAIQRASPHRLKVTPMRAHDSSTGGTRPAKT